MAKRSGGDITINANSSNVNVRSKLKNSRQTINKPSSAADELNDLMVRLKEALAGIELNHPKEAADVECAATAAVAEATSTQPDRQRGGATLEGLKRAADAVKDIAPAVFAVATQIIHFVASIFGL